LIAPDVTATVFVVGHPLPSDGLKNPCLDPISSLIEDDSRNEA
jgi:hypothetical protein